jgi:hypothetical protein
MYVAALLARPHASPRSQDPEGRSGSERNRYHDKSPKRSPAPGRREGQSNRADGGSRTRAIGAQARAPAATRIVKASVQARLAWPLPTDTT